MKNRYFLFPVIAGLVIFGKLNAQNVQLSLVTDQLTSPTAIANAGDGSGRLFILEQTGTVVMWNGTSTSTFLDITDRVVSGGERGLLGIAFHPDFETNGYFYLNYTTEDPGLTTRVSRFEATSANQADPASEQILIEIAQPYANHNGGALLFGDDGYLYIATGDGGSFGDPSENAQNLNSLLGKILRIDVNSGTPYAIPSTNPFVGTTGAEEEIFAYGFRNPWRMSIDKLTGTIWIGDVGQGSWEEVDTLIAGENYGWDIMEGNHCYEPSTGCDMSGLILPVYEYARETPHCSITGGYVYRGNGTSIENGTYVFGDYCSGYIWGLTFDGAGSPVVNMLIDANFTISSFGEDENGELYVLDHAGALYLIEEIVTGTSSPDQANVHVYPNPASSVFQIEIPEGEVALFFELYDMHGKVVKQIKNQAASSTVSTFHCEGLPSGLYRLKVISRSGKQFTKQILIKE